MSHSVTIKLVEQSASSGYELDDGISIRCVTTAARNGYPRRAADGCQIDLRRGGGSVGCPDCPYKLGSADTIAVKYGLHT